MLTSLTIQTTTGLLLTAALSAMLLAVCWQDVRERQVSLLLLLLLLGGCVGRYLLSAQPVVFPLINGLFLLLQGAVVLLYLFVRYRTTRLGNYLGSGDLLFWLACLWCFSPLNFLLFFVSSLMGALLLHLVVRQLRKAYQQVLVPLAGFQGLFLLLALLMEGFNPAWSTYNDFPLFNALGLAW